MRNPFKLPAALLAFTICISSRPGLATDIVSRTPNIPSVELPPPGSANFMFNHRITGLAAISSAPTFTFDAGVLPWLSIFAAYSSKAQDVALPGFEPVTGAHDLNIGLRQGILHQSSGDILSLTTFEGLGTAGLAGGGGTAPWYSGGLTSKSPEEGLGVTAARSFGPFGLLTSLRATGFQYSVLGSRNILYTTPGFRTGATLGVTYAITPHMALVGDWGKYLDGLSGVPAWSIALQGAIPYTPHLLAIEVSNVPTTTMGGINQAAQSDLYGGFAFAVHLPSLKPWAKMVTPTWLLPKADAQAGESAPAAVAGAPKETAVVPVTVVQPAVAGAPVTASTGAANQTEVLATANDDAAALADDLDNDIDEGFASTGKTAGPPAAVQAEEDAVRAERSAAAAERAAQANQAAAVAERAAAKASHAVAAAERAVAAAERAVALAKSAVAQASTGDQRRQTAAARAHSARRPSTKHQHPDAPVAQQAIRVATAQSQPVLSVPAAAPSVAPPAPLEADAALIEKGKALFLGRAAGMGCAMCHGEKGSGDSGPDIRGKSESAVRAAFKQVAAMSAFEGLPEGEIKALTAYVKVVGQK